MNLSRRAFLGACAASFLGCDAAGGATRRPRRILLLAGRKSHGYGAHEHPAGCALLADRLNRIDGIAAATCLGWPENEAVLAEADALLVYADGEGGHPLSGRFDALAPHVARGLGLGLLHYALIVAGEEEQARLMEWIGGRYELDWSVNPHWTARVEDLPRHPVTRGVKPFALEDEWYYHLRFRSGMEGVTPLLTALPPPESLNRQDGPHSGNPAVRRAVLVEKRPQHLAWCAGRAGGGRGFGFTGGHAHWNWAHDGFRTLVVNAACWLAGKEVPTGGFATARPGLDELVAGLGPPPAEFDRAAVEALLAGWSGE